MGSLGEVATTSAKGSVILFFGSAASLVVDAVGSILVVRMLSPSEYGLFVVSLVLPGLFLLFSDFGVDSALVRFIALYRSEERPRMIGELGRIGFLFKLVLGVGLSSALFFLSDILAALLLRRPEVGGLVRLASLLVLSQSIENTALSVLAGLERMDYRAAVRVFQAVVKGVCSPLLVHFGLGVSGAVIGYVLGHMVAASVGFLFTVLSSSRVKNLDEGSTDFVEGLRLMLGFGLPLFLGVIVAGFAGWLGGFLRSWFVSDALIGNYGVASRFTQLIVLVTGAIGVVLFPAFSKFSYDVEPIKTREVFQGSVRYSSIVVLPLTFLLMAISKPVVYTLFSAKYPQTPLYLQLLLVPNILVGIGSLSIGGFLNSQGETRIRLKVGLTGSIASILLSPVLIWIWGIEGFLIAIIISNIIRNLFGLIVLRRKYNLSPEFGHTRSTLLCSAISAGSAYGVLWYFSVLTPLQGLFTGSVIFITIYLILAPIIGALKEGDIDNLDSMLRDLRFIYPIARFIFFIEKKILRLKRARSREIFRPCYDH